MCIQANVAQNNQILASLIVERHGPSCENEGTPSKHFTGASGITQEEEHFPQLEPEVFSIVSMKATNTAPMNDTCVASMNA